MNDWCILLIEISSK